jgi:protein SCO1/2
MNARSFAQLAGAVLVIGLGSFAVRAHGDHVHGPAGQREYLRSTAAYALPEATLIDAGRGEVRVRDALAGEGPLFVNFIFTSCTAICPVMSATFAQLQQLLVKEQAPARLVSISIDPEHDTVARLREYAQRLDARPGWHFLTGSAADSLAVQRAFDVYRGDKMGHDPVTFMRLSPSQPWLRLDGFASAAQILDEYHRLSHESPAHEILH